MVFHPTPMMLAEPNKYVINNLITEKERERHLNILVQRRCNIHNLSSEKVRTSTPPYFKQTNFYLCEFVT